MIFHVLTQQIKQYFSLAKYRKHYERSFGIRLLVLLLLLVLMVLTNTWSMMRFDGLSFGDGLWVSLTSVTTVGYGDFSASSTLARIITVVTIYLMGITLLAQIAAEFFESRINIREMKVKGLWRWKAMNEHLLIINTPKYNKEQYLGHLLSQIRKTPDLEDIPIQMLTNSYTEGLPASLVDLNLVHYSGVPEDDQNLRAVGVDKAKYILLLAKNHADPVSDSLTFDLLCRIKSIGSDALIIAEATRDKNRQRLFEAGANIVIRPIRAYPELLVRAMVAPGTEAILENMFKHDGDHMERYELSFSNKNWGDLICQFVKDNYGIPLAYINEEGLVVSNPDVNTSVSGKGLILLINTRQLHHTMTDMKQRLR